MYHKNKMMRTVLNFEGGALRKDPKLDMDLVSLSLSSQMIKVRLTIKVDDY